MIDNREIIENYFSLTGRPIATMTVEEYLLFLKASTKNAGSFADSRLKPASDVSPGIPDKASQPAESFVQANKNGNETEAPATQKEDNVLQMLKSIAG